MLNEISIKKEDEDQACAPLIERIQMAGVNHRTAPVDLREKAALGKGSAEALRELKTKLGLDEIVALSTCNRNEFYWTAKEPVAPELIFQSLAGLDPGELTELAPCIYSDHGLSAARHLFQVACGLDSLVLGETQILNQVKRAYERSHEIGLTDTSLNILFQKTFEAAKKVHTQTRIASERASIPSLALKLTEAIFDNLAEAYVLVIGTGEMARVTVDNLKKRGAQNIAFVTRTAQRARDWSCEYSGHEIVTLDELDEVLWKADIVIACTMTAEPIITKDRIQSAQQRRRHRRPLLVLDLGLPRNVAPEVGKLAQIYLHNIDDLQAIVDKNKGRLEIEVRKAKVIIDALVANYNGACREAEAADAIREVRSRVQEMAAAELNLTMRKMPDLTPKEQEEIATLVHRILGKILHHPVEGLRQASRNGHGDEAAEWARILFGIQPPQN